MSKITLHLSKDETRLKDMIKVLQETKKGENPYYNRSESEIAKMVLEPALDEIYKQYIIHSRESSASKEKQN